MRRSKPGLCLIYIKSVPVRYNTQFKYQIMVLKQLYPPDQAGSNCAPKMKLYSRSKFHFYREKKKKKNAINKAE